MIIIYDTRTGNIERFIAKLRVQHPEWNFQKLTAGLLVDREFHFITHTTGRGLIPKSTQTFMENNHKYALSVTCSGNMNWGINYGKAGDILSEQYSIPLLMKFELSGTPNEIKKYINLLQNYYATKQMDSTE